MSINLAALRQLEELRGSLVDPTRAAPLRTIVLDRMSQDYGLPQEMRFTIYPDNSVIQSQGFDAKNDIRYSSYDEVLPHIDNLLASQAYAVHQPQIAPAIDVDAFHAQHIKAPGATPRVRTVDDVLATLSKPKAAYVERLANIPMNDDVYRDYGDKIVAERQLRRKRRSSKKQRRASDGRTATPTPMPTAPRTNAPRKRRSMFSKPTLDELNTLRRGSGY